MRRSLSHLRRGLLGAAFLGSLGFGAAQAFATPTTAARTVYCMTPQERTDCYLSCQEAGLVGYCYPDIGCRCEIM